MASTDDRRIGEANRDSREAASVLPAETDFSTRGAGRNGTTLEFHATRPTHRDYGDEQRVIVLAPAGADVAICRSILARIDVRSDVVADIAELVAALESGGAAAVMLTEDVVATPDVHRLMEFLRYQPAWSDLPVLMLSTGPESPMAARAVALLGNVVILDRPIRVAAVVSAVRTAIRARQRQYALREQMEALRQSEERFELATQATHDAIWDLDYSPRHAARYVRFAYGWGLAEHESGLDEWAERIHPDDRERVVASLRDALDGSANVWSAEYRFRGADGSYMNIFDRGQILRDAEGRAVRAVGAMMDMTESKRSEEKRKLADEELRRHDAHLRLLWESAAVLLTTDRPDAMLRGVFDKIAPHFRIDAYLNYLVDESADTLKLESWAGIRERDIETIRHIAPSDHLCGKVAAERRAIAVHHIQESREPDLALERKLGFRACAGNPLIADGRLLGTLSFATRTNDEFRPDELEFFATICRYVTAAYERLFLIRRLRDSDHRKDEFLATLAHELRNPLAPIRNALEIMRVNGSGSAVDTAARTMIERQLEQMVRLVDDLLDVSRITQGRLELRKERVALREVVKSALDTSRPWIEAGRHALEVSIPDESLYLDADPVRLAQVFSNLLNNAARYMEPGGHIWLTASAADGAVTVRVRDAGHGIEPGAIARIFDMFTQASASRDRAQGGLGVGLTLVKRLVEMHGGSVIARSEGVGAGAEFEVRLPLAAEPPAAKGVAPAAAAAHTIACRVLVADDNRDAAESMGMLLRLMGNDVKIAHDGLEAVELGAEFLPDIVLMDIGMPRLNGYEAARRMRGQPWSDGTLFVALTGWGQVEDKRKASEAGFDRHFTKPLDPSKLQALMEEYRADH